MISCPIIVALVFWNSEFVDLRPFTHSEVIVNNTLVGQCSPVNPFVICIFSLLKHQRCGGCIPNEVIFAQFCRIAQIDTTVIEHHSIITSETEDISWFIRGRRRPCHVHFICSRRTRFWKIPERRSVDRYQTSWAWCDVRVGHSVRDVEWWTKI